MYRPYALAASCAASFMAVVDTTIVRALGYGATALILISVPH
jgi:hypothetical protein